MEEKKKEELRRKSSCFLQIGLNGGRQWRTDGTEYGIALGFCLRYMDTTNATEGEVVRGLQRIVSEMDRLGMKRGTERKLVKRLSMRAWYSTRELREMKKWTENDHEEFREKFDSEERARISNMLRSAALEEERFARMGTGV